MSKTRQEIARKRAQNRVTYAARVAAVKVRHREVGPDGPLRWEIDRTLVEKELGRSMSAQEEAAARAAYQRGYIG